jgi:BASS family bile acid:Na+ symporter
MFQHYAAYEYHLAAAQLVLAMLGMGATLKPGDFWAVARTPQRVGLALLVQFGVVPLAATLLCAALNLPPGIAVGLVLVAAMPSGSISNIYTHLGRGNIALSITVTAVSTLLCLVATPLVMRGFSGANLPAGFAMPLGHIVREIVLCLLLPLAVGMAVGRFAPSIQKPFGAWCLRGSLAALGAIVVGSLGSGRLQLSAYGWTAPAAIVVLAAGSQAVAFGAARACRFGPADSYTLGIEVALRNTNLAVLLKASLFPATAGRSDPLADGVLFAALFYGGAALAVLLPAVLLRRRGAKSEFDESKTGLPPPHLGARPTRQSRISSPGDR